MSTRSYVGIIKDNKVLFGYHHSDSHLESLGISLFNEIKTEAEADEKISHFAEMEESSEETRESFFSIPGKDIHIDFFMDLM